MAYDIEETLDIEGHDVVKVSYPISSYVADKGFNDYIVRILDKDNFDCIFTMNYIPALAENIIPAKNKIYCMDFR